MRLNIKSARNLNMKLILRNMKRINIILIMLLVFSGLFTMQSCKEDEGTFKEYGSFTDPVLVAPANRAFLDETATVDLIWESTDADGDPQNWTVYFGDSDDPGVIHTGYTQQTVTVNVIKGTKYYWKVVAMDVNGVITRGPMWSFEIIDPDAPMTMEMSWSTNVEEAIGLEVDPEDAIDLRLLIVPEAKADEIIVDGSGFEEYNDFDQLPDGKYLIKTDIFSTLDAGDFNKSLNVSINLVFRQRGILSKSLPFPDVMTNDFPCESYKTVLAEVTKTGSTYEVVSKVDVEWSVDPLDLVGDWAGTDNVGFDDVVTISDNGDGVSIWGLGFGWFESPDFWSENVVGGGPVPLVFDFTKLGVISIADQYYITSDWDDDYNLRGTAKINLCGDIPVLTFEYDIAYTGDADGIGVTYLGELFTITLKPVAKGSVVSRTTSPHPNIPLPQKPVR